MKLELRLAAPDDVDVTLTITMPLRAWRRVREQLARAEWHNAPALDVGAAIARLVEHAEHVFDEGEADG